MSKPKQQIVLLNQIVTNNGKDVGQTIQELSTNFHKKMYENYEQVTNKSPHKKSISDGTN